MFKYDESALDLYRRLHCSPFHVCFDRRTNKPEAIEYGELVEVQTQMGAMTEAVLETAISYSNACDAGIVIHISAGGNLRNSLLHGKVQMQRYPALADMDANNRLKGVTVNSLSQLSEVMEILATTLGGESTLVIAEGLNPLVLAQKVVKYLHASVKGNSYKHILENRAISSFLCQALALDGTLQRSSELTEFLASLTRLQKSQNVIVLWFTTVLPRNSGGLREMSNRDPLSVLWKDKCQRIIQHTPGT